MKIKFIGPAYPYRGGLATIIETLARTFAGRGGEVSIDTFSLQYPRLLFPGKSQFRTGPAPKDLTIERTVSTVNPLSWWRVGRKLRRQRPDLVVLKYWTPLMAPCFGTICRLARKNGKTKVVVHVDNITPHENHFYDRVLNRYFLRSVDGFVYMSEAVKSDLDTYGLGKPALFSPHPLFDTYGQRVDRTEACVRLGLDPQTDYTMFFGYIRDYKGLDLLIDAWAMLHKRGLSEGRKLLVVGEVYGADTKYTEQIARLGIEDEVVMHTRFVPDGEVADYFSVAQMVALPYKSATQSGVTQVAYAFGVPMIVTRVGGLAEIVPDGVVGLLADVSAESVAEAIEKAWQEGNLDRFREGIEREKHRFSWDATADVIEQLYGQIK
ncbi:MAG: glycosyltransferase [Tidjanibacter sp.]|nr:glycosyltransferase [Tidjanibacter sp.]